MSVKPIREHTGKALLQRWLPEYSEGRFKMDNAGVLISPEVLTKTVGPGSWAAILEANPWLKETNLVAKPDQLIKRRGKAGLLSVNKPFVAAQDWIMQRMCKEQKVETVTGQLTHFLIEPFVPHKQEEEFYICIVSNRYDDELLFCHEGGVDVGDVDAKAERLQVLTGDSLSTQQVVSSLLSKVPAAKQENLALFIVALFNFYKDLHFAYLEINPLVMLGDNKTVVPLDMAAKLDETAIFLTAQKWGEIDYPPPFGRDAYPEEALIRDMDGRTGASLKLTILNERGRVWTMVAGGGASVVYADTVADYGWGHELANYGEYSGAPSTEETFVYAKTLLSLMLRSKHPEGKFLIIGGGIANFTDVAATFTGLIQAFEHYAEEIKEHNIKIFIRRAGPNYLEGLRKVKAASEKLGLGVKVYGPETHITAVVPMALGLMAPLPEPDLSVPCGPPPRKRVDVPAGKGKAKKHKDVAAEGPGIFSPETTSIVYGLQHRAVQGMLDFDHMCKRKKPSVEALIFPFSGNHMEKFYWGTGEILVPVYTTTQEAVAKHPGVSVFINFASFRSVFETSMEALNYPSMKTLAIIAEGVPERQTREIIKVAEAKGIKLIGPATVGGIKPGCLRIGNTGGMLDNIVMSRLYRPGSVAYVSKSGGMSNELNNIVCRNSDGVYEGVAIGGDRYPGSRFLDHFLKYQDDPGAKILLLLGEVGGCDEYDLIEAKKSGRITKPVIAWCVGTCASCFATEVQFGHAGAQARGDTETAAAKNKAMAEVGFYVPESFDKLPETILEVYTKMVMEGAIVEKPEEVTPAVPLDYTWAKKLGLVRKPANFISSISDDRGEELKYGGMTISDVFSQNLGIGGVLSLLWFRKRLPQACCKFIEMILMVTADHGPAVSGAHNAIVTARAGKDLVSALVSGLLTIGPRFGGALDDAARMFKEAHDSGMSPKSFVESCKKHNKLIMGIGHRIKSLANPDQRVVIIKNFAKKHFGSTPVLDFACGVEQITTSKRANLILNVDGCIAVCFVDMIRSCGAFSPDEVEDLLSFGCLNGLFVLGRSTGFIAHYIDQLRLKQPLYRHPWDDITYIDNLAGQDDSKDVVMLKPKAQGVSSDAQGTGSSAGSDGGTIGEGGVGGPCSQGVCRVVRDTCTVA